MIGTVWHSLRACGDGGDGGSVATIDVDATRLSVDVHASSPSWNRTPTAPSPPGNSPPSGRSLLRGAGVGVATRGSGGGGIGT